MKWGPTILIAIVDLLLFGDEELGQENIASFDCTVNVGLMNLRCTHLLTFVVVIDKLCR